MTLQSDLENELSEKSGGKPKILLLTQVLPFPPDAGPKIKTYNLIKFLSQNYDLTLVSFVRDDNTPSQVAELLKYCRAVHTVRMKRSRQADIFALLSSLISNQPFLMVRDRRGEMSALLAKLANQEKYTVVHADQLNMAQYALEFPGVARVLDEHNAVWTIVDRLRGGEKNPLKKAVLALETFKLKRYEQKVCRKFDEVLAVTEEDEKQLGLDCQLIPIGVEVAGIEPLKREAGSPNLVSLGTMFYPPNIEGALWFGKQIFPIIQQTRPDATYSIIGARPPDAIYEMARQNPAIKVLGYVENIRPVLEKSAGLVVPLLSGGGMRVKILEALALELPFVSTTVGAEGVAVNHGKHALLADSPEDFAAACLRLLDPQGPGPQLARAGRELALQKYDYRQAYVPLNSIYQNLLNQSHR